jgi:hypothetical protein
MLSTIKTKKRRGINDRRSSVNQTTEVAMKAGDPLKTSKPIRSQRTGVLLPREGTFVRAVENLGRKLILVNFGTAGDEYLFPEEIVAESGQG